MGQTIAEVDMQLEKAHTRLMRADRRNDADEVADACTELDVLLEVRFHLLLRDGDS